MPFSIKILPAILATVTISLQAQMGPPIPAGETFYAGEVLGVFQGSADMNAGGDMSIHRLGFKFGAIRGLDGGSSIGGGLSYTMLGYRFEGVPALGGFNPWEDIDQLQLSLQYRYAIDRKSSLFLMPSVTSSGESGASFSDSIEFGAIFGYTKTFSRELTLGIGGGAFYGLEDTATVSKACLRSVDSIHGRTSTSYNSACSIATPSIGNPPCSSCPA